MTEYLDRYPTMHEYAEGKRINPKLTDLISRADAIEAVCDDWCGYPYSKCPHKPQRMCDGCDTIEVLRALPSADAVQGEWIDIDNYYRLATCSHCRKVTMFEKWGEYTKPYNFCPNCDARMKGGDTE